jgi:hypothetical protein
MDRTENEKKKMEGTRPESGSHKPPWYDTESTENEKIWGDTQGDSSLSAEFKNIWHYTQLPHMPS